MFKVQVIPKLNDIGNVTKKSRKVEDDVNKYRIEKKPKLVSSPLAMVQLPSKEDDSIHMMKLPRTCISLCSEKGQRLLEEACTTGTAKGFFETLVCLEPQSELKYCGIASLVSVLNALGVDPARIWRGRFRWYDASMLAEEEKLDEIKDKGMTLEELVQLTPKDKVEVKSYLASMASLNEFRNEVLDFSSSIESSMIVCYNRQTLMQEGNGHFSPIGAYHKGSDSVLVLDVARYKYPPYWVDCGLLWKAMTGIDQESGKTRGFIKISKFPRDWRS